MPKPPVPPPPVTFAQRAVAHLRHRQRRRATCGNSRPKK
jgi:hypothetical protein